MDPSHDKTISTQERLQVQYQFKLVRSALWCDWSELLLWSKLGLFFIYLKYLYPVFLFRREPKAAYIIKRQYVEAKKQ